jgi:hypothetical protein
MIERKRCKLHDIDVETKQQKLSFVPENFRGFTSTSAH